MNISCFSLARLFAYQKISFYPYVVEWFWFRCLLLMTWQLKRGIVHNYYYYYNYYYYWLIRYMKHAFFAVMMIIVIINWHRLYCVVSENIHTPHGGHFCLRPQDHPPRWNFHSRGCLLYPPPPPPAISVIIQLGWNNCVKNVVALYYYANFFSAIKWEKCFLIHVNTVSNNLKDGIGIFWNYVIWANEEMHRT